MLGGCWVVSGGTEECSTSRRRRRRLQGCEGSCWRTRSETVDGRGSAQMEQVHGVDSSLYEREWVWSSRRHRWWQVRYTEEQW